MLDAAQAALVDQTPLKTAQALAQVADTKDEQELAQAALRLSDYELDLSFNIALQSSSPRRSVAYSARSKIIKARQKRARRLNCFP